MSNYENDQEKIVNAVGQTVQAAVTTGVNWWLSRPKSVQIKIKTASQEMEEIRQSLKQGKSPSSILKTLEKGATAKRALKSGGNPKKTANLLLKKGQIDLSVNLLNHRNKNLKQNLKSQKTL
ncbi:MAG: hypothetical protein AB4062_04220 [Crocosphaera sp.]